jgi:hypothetical protein
MAFKICRQIFRRISFKMPGLHALRKHFHRATNLPRRHASGLGPPFCRFYLSDRRCIDFPRHSSSSSGSRASSFSDTRRRRCEQRKPGVPVSQHLRITSSSNVSCQESTMLRRSMSAPRPSKRPPGVAGRCRLRRSSQFCYGPVKSPR